MAPAEAEGFLARVWEARSPGSRPAGSRSSRPISASAEREGELSPPAPELWTHLRRSAPVPPDELDMQLSELSPPVPAVWGEPPALEIPEASNLARGPDSGFRAPTPEDRAVHDYL